MKLGLGTVQFGVPYGVSNTHGQPDAAEVKRILLMAENAGVSVLDTATSYGEAEATLGQSLGPHHNFAIVTKTPVLGGGRTVGESIDILRSTFETSLRRMKQDSVYGLLLHQSADLFTPEGQRIADAMLELVENGLVQKIGVSVYTAEEIDGVLNVFTPDLVQLPLSIFDQRLLCSGHLAMLKSRGMEIHVRSVFLQGLMLMESAPAYFQPIRGHMERYAEFLRQTGMSRIEAALSFVSAVPEVDVAIVGVACSKELAEVLSAHERAKGRRENFAAFAIEDESMVNPALWKLH